jgi:integrase
MARRPRAARLETRTARLKLKVRKKPYDFTSISAGIQLGYRRCKGAGRWVVKVADGHGSYWTKRVAYADDHENADGEHILTWWQAQDKARALARGKDAGGRPATVAEALADYEADLIARSASPTNARRVRTLLPSTMLAKPVALLTPRELKHLRDGLIGKGAKPASVNRDLKGFKAALNLAAAHDPRITNGAVWRTALAALPAAHYARNVILTDEQVRALIAAAYAEDSALGLLVETAAVTGARVSQLGRLEVGDLQADRPDPRVMMPSSRKGRGHKRIDRKPVPITADLAAKLKRAAGDRAPTDSLLLRADGTPWRPATADYRLPFISVVRRVGLDPTTVTLYSLRHSSIVRALLAGVPVRLCAVGHDTSIAMIEKSYSAFISDHADSLLRRALLDVAQPASGNVVALPGRWP